jgi:repressor LexA
MLLIFAGLLVYVIVALILRKTLTVHVGVCPEHLRRHRTRRTIGLLCVGSAIIVPIMLGYLTRIDPSMFNPLPHYLLRVEGMSMRNAGILDGDLVAVHRTPEVRNLQIVVARLEDEVTVKRYRQKGKIVWLLPENPDFEPIQVNLDEQTMMIEGVVVGLLRNGMPLKN